MNYQITLLCISLVCAGSMLVLLRKSLLHPLHAVWWLAVGSIILLVGLFPRSFDALGHALGVTYPPALYLAIAVVVMLIRIMVADLERCKMMLQQRRMNQHLARLALRVRQLEQATRTGGGGADAATHREDASAAVPPESVAASVQSAAVPASTETSLQHAAVPASTETSHQHAAVPAQSPAVSQQSAVTSGSSHE